MKKIKIKIFLLNFKDVERKRFGLFKNLRQIEHFVILLKIIPNGQLR